ncbi:MAG: AMP-binding protein [Actinomycetota bacterium]|nr:AMP-binding protein [Actinomycetota bacterium]
MKLHQARWLCRELGRARAMTGPSIGTILDRTARRFGDKPAIVCGGSSISFAELGVRSSKVAAWLYSIGVGPGHRVALIRDPGIEFVEDEFGIYKAGCAEVALNPRFTVHEKLRMLRFAEPTVVLIDERYRDLAQEVGMLPSVRAVVVGEERERALASAGFVHEDESQAGDDLLWRLHFSSGSTGMPKAAALTHRNFIASIASYRAAVGGISSDEILLNAAPLVTAGGWALWTHVVAGCTCVLLPRFAAESYVDSVARHGATTSLLVPTMLSDLVTVDVSPAAGLLRTVLYTASAISAPVLDAALEKFGPIFVQSYSMSETMSALSVLGRKDHLDPDPAIRKSAGFPAWEVDIRTVGDDGRPTEIGEPGRIVIRTESMMREYWREPDLTAETIRDGWLYSNDVGTLDERGRLFVLDRSDDVVITSGFNVYPREVEDVLARHPAVKDVAIVGRSEPRVGQIVIACVQLRDSSVTDQQLIDFTREFLATYKVPREIHRHDSGLPRNPAGKILRRQLRQEAAGQPTGCDSEVRSV